MIHWQQLPPPSPPFYASVFNYELSEFLEGYQTYDAWTLERVKTYQGFLGYEVLKQDRRGSFISYWKDLESIQSWAQDPIHIKAKALGINQWYKSYHSAITKIIRFKEFTNDSGNN